MQRRLLAIALGVLFVACQSTTHEKPSEAPPHATSVAAGSAVQAPAWNFNASIIEACSCPMFCQCYFNPQPAEHPGCCPPNSDPKAPPRYCRFNNVYRVNHGSVGNTKLDGAKFWLAGDLGGDFTKGEMQWCVLHFDPSVAKEQREGIATILGYVYPVKWGSFTVAKDAPIEWNYARDRAVARLDGGKLGEVVLVKNAGMTEEPIVIKNLRYWGVPRNDGFVLMANDVEAYRTGDKPYEFKGTNGFFITVDITSKDVPAGKAY